MNGNGSFMAALVGELDCHLKSMLNGCFPSPNVGTPVAFSSLWRVTRLLSFSIMCGVIGELGCLMLRTSILLVRPKSIEIRTSPRIITNKEHRIANVPQITLITNNLLTYPGTRQRHKININTRCL